MTSKKQLQAKLKESLFDPRAPGRFAVIIDGVSAEYLIQRAQEFLRSPTDTSIRDAISILAFARTINGA